MVPVATPARAPQAPATVVPPEAAKEKDPVEAKVENTPHEVKESEAAETPQETPQEKQSKAAKAAQDHQSAVTTRQAPESMKTKWIQTFFAYLSI